MADNETDALLKDLESRASGPAKSASKDEGGEDIEAFLRSLEGDDYIAPPEPKSTTKTKTADPLDDQFAGLEAAPDAPMEKAAKPDRAAERAAKKAAKEAEKAAKAAEKAAKAEEKAAKKAAAKEPAEGTEVAARADATGESTGLQKAARVLKWTAVLVPLLAAWWVLGAYLSNWVSAGWLVFLLSTAVVFGLPLAFRMGIKRGRYIWWTAATSALIAIGLVAPLTEPASNALWRYGHWPSTALGEVAGLDPTSPLVRANAAIGEWVGAWIHPKAEEDRFAQQLGKSDPLNPEDAPKPEPVPPTPDPNATPQPPVVPPPVVTPPVVPPPVVPPPVAPTPEAPQPVVPAPAVPAPVTPTPQPPQPGVQPPPPTPAPTPEAPAPEAPQPKPESPAPVAPSPDPAAKPADGAPTN